MSIRPCRAQVISHSSLLIIISKQRWQKGFSSRKKNLPLVKGPSHPWQRYELGRYRVVENKHTLQTKHSGHHFPPSTSSASMSFRIGFLHFLHFGIRRRTWQCSQYGCPLCTVKPSPAPLSKVPSPEKFRAVVLGGRNGSPHSAQKKCCVWYVRFPSPSVSLRVIKSWSAIAV